MDALFDLPGVPGCWTSFEVYTALPKEEVNMKQNSDVGGALLIDEEPAIVSDTQCGEPCPHNDGGHCIQGMGHTEPHRCNACSQMWG